MPFWFTLALFVGTTVLSALLQRRPKDVQPSSLGDFQAPTAEEGRSIPVIFGTVKIKGPNVVWYGDLRTDPIRKTSSSILGIPISKTTVGYNYFLGMQMALCHGPVDALIDIEIGEKSLSEYTEAPPNTLEEQAFLFFGGFSYWLRGMDPALPYSRPLESKVGFHISAPTLFGGEEREGGIAGPATFYFGAQDQESDAFLSARFGETAPAYRGICHIVLGSVGTTDIAKPEGPQWWLLHDTNAVQLATTRRVYIGTSSYLKDWAFVLKRCPDHTCANPDIADLDGDANPAEIILEILMNPVWGLGRPESRIDVASFEAAAQTLADEAMGMSIQIDDAAAADQVIQDVLRHIDGVLYTDPSTGLWTLKLVRDDYDPGTLPELTPAEVSEVQFSRGSWRETLNEIKIEYTDRSENFTPRVVQAQETANFAAVGELTSETISFRGFSNATIAQTVAIRELKVLSYPLVKVHLTCNRTAWDFRIGGVFKFTWPPLGIDGMVLRITAIKYGLLEDGKIEIDAVEDIFAVSDTAYSAPSGSRWVDPTGNPEPPDGQVAIEAPYQLLPTTLAEERVMVGCARGDLTSRGYRVYADEGAGWHETNLIEEFTPSGMLTSDYLRTTDALDEDGFTLEDGRDLDTILGTDAAGRDRGDCLLMFTNLAGEPTEICAFTTVTDNGDGTFTFKGIVRGVYDTLPQDHEANASDSLRVWIIRDRGVMLIHDYKKYPLDSSAGGDQFIVVED